MNKELKGQKRVRFFIDEAEDIKKTIYTDVKFNKYKRPAIVSIIELPRNP